MAQLTDKEIVEIYNLINEYWGKYLKDRDVKIPGLFRNQTYTTHALTLVYLAKNYPDTRWVTKSELTSFIRHYHPATNDVQSARHLGMQDGFYIVSSTRGNFIPINKEPPKAPAYLLVNLEEPHPAFSPKRREVLSTNDFEEVKRQYGNRCVTCGSEEGKVNLRYPEVVTQLQQAHRNPNLPLDRENLMPQCQLCNRADRNYWVYDKRGRVIGIAQAKVVIASIKKGFLSAEQVEFIKQFFEALKKNDEQLL